MDSNRGSVTGSGGLGLLAAAVDALAAEDLTRLPDAEAAHRVLTLRRLADRLDGQFLRELAAVDGRGAAGADIGVQAESTAAWLRGRLRAGHPQSQRLGPHRAGAVPRPTRRHCPGAGGR